MKRQIGKILLAACLVVSMLPFTVSAGTGGVIQHQTPDGKLTEAEAVQDRVKENKAQTAEMSNEELFAEYLERLFLGESQEEVSLFGETGHSRLTSALDLAIYDYLRAEIEKIAAGERTSSVISIPTEVITEAAFGENLVARSINGEEMPTLSAEALGVESIVNYNEQTEQFELNREAYEAFVRQVCPDFNRVLDCLLSDLPYDCYWYDKTASTTWNPIWFSYFVYNDGTAYIIPMGESQFQFPVSGEYQDPEAEQPEYTLEPGRVRAATAAAENAKRIVEEYKDLSDYEKLCAYLDEICTRVSYDDDAAASGNALVGMDPWQLINVFDDDPDTNVVCEGYAKAFQYLFDMSSFQSDQLRSILITGQMADIDDETGEIDNKEHMWNIVTMDDGKNYLFDVTNCDEDTVGSPDYLILCGTTGSVRQGYSVTVEKDGYVPKRVFYSFDSDQIDLYGEDRLTLSEKPYDPDADIWQNDFEYSLNEEKLTITVTSYLGEEAEVIIPPTAMIDGKTYQTVIEDSVFDQQKTRITVIEDLNETVGSQYNEDLDVTMAYEPAETAGNFVLDIVASDNEQVREWVKDFRVIEAHYDQNGQMTGMEFLEGVQNDQGVTFSGRLTEQEDRLMLLDSSEVPVMEALTM